MTDFREKFGQLDDDVLLTVEEVAALIPCSPAGMYKRIERDPGTMPPAIRIGRQIRFRVGDVRAWIRSLSQGPLANMAAESAATAVPRRTGRRRMSPDVLGISAASKHDHESRPPGGRQWD